MKNNLCKLLSLYKLDCIIPEKVYYSSDIYFYNEVVSKFMQIGLQVKSQIQSQGETIGLNLLTLSVS